MARTIHETAREVSQPAYPVSTKNIAGKMVPNTWLHFRTSVVLPYLFRNKSVKNEHDCIESNRKNHGKPLKVPL